MARFLVMPLVPGRVSLPAREARHAARVLRLRPGDPVTLFDGHGYEAAGRIVAMSRGRVEVAVEAPFAVERRPPRTVTIAGALPKGRRAAVMIEKLCELGVARFVPVRWERSGRCVELPRLQRVAVAAAKQCGRADVMQVAHEHDPAAALALAREHDQSLWAHPRAQQSLGAALRPGSVVAYVGPEGGWTVREEEQLAQSGARSVRLAPTILRVETAAVVLAAGIWAVG